MVSETTWRHRMTVSIVILLLCIAVALTADYRLFKSVIGLHYAYGAYASALAEYAQEHNSLPGSLRALESNYLAKGPRSGQLPPPEGYERPMLFVRKSGDGATHLLILSPPSARVWGIYDLRITYPPVEGIDWLSLVVRDDPAARGWERIE